MDLTVWVWLSAAAILLVGEVLAGDRTILPFGVGALLAAGLAAARVPAQWQWLTFGGTAFVLTVVIQRARSRGKRD